VQPVVTVEDAGGNTVVAANTITLAITAPANGGVLVCTSNALATTAGVAGFAACHINLASGIAYTLTATATTGGFTVASGNVLVSVGSPAQVAFTRSPNDSTGGVAFTLQPIVKVQDAGGNTITTDSTTSVTLSITTAAGGTLTCAGGNSLVVTSGVAGFAACKIDRENPYTLTATDGSLVTGTSAAFAITVGTAAKLVFLTQPVGALHGANFANQPDVVVTDLGGNVVTTDTSSVTLAITASTGAGVLTCTTNPLTAIAGDAPFAGCAISLAGTYTLTASDSVGGVTSIASNPVTIA
jgi:trimeric autotransporter adhesin